MKWTIPVRLAAVAMIVALGHASAWAAAVDLADSPLVSGVSKPTPPNIYFILDDSTSMSWDYMPDDVDDATTAKVEPVAFTSLTSRACFKNFGANKIYYNPNITYSAPLKSDGTSYPNADFTNAEDDGYGVTSTSSTNLAAGDTQSLSSNPFATQSGSKTVTVTDSGHGQGVGATVTFSGVSGGGTVNGVTGLNGAYTIASVIDANTYTITAGNNASGVARALGNNPFTTTTPAATRRTVTVADNGHGRLAGSTVTFSGVSGGGAVRGATGLNGTFTIVTVVNANSYRITVVAPGATSAGTGGGNAVVATYPNGTGGGGSVQATYSNSFYYEYTSNPSSPPTTCQANGSYTKRPLLTAAARQNFANWYSYYRTRINMMKSASGRAFEDVDDEFRVGFGTISETGTASTGFLKIAKFDAAQKSSWYSILYGASPFGPGGSTNYTPLRGALSKAGRMYSGKLAGAKDADDPVQFSCQQNYTILTTDGYWNLTDESTGSPKYGPYREDNATLVGDQDGVTGTVRPYLDAGKYSNTLADIAMYYYKTDLRTATSGSKGGLLDDGVTRLDVYANNVPVTKADPIAQHQRMELFGLGLGVAGKLAYRKDYLTASSGDYYDIINSGKNWPNPDVTNTSNQVLERIDDLWHASVNARGQYLSASNPDDVIDALSTAIKKTKIEDYNSSAAATSTLEPVTGDRSAFVAQYTTGYWYGDLKSKFIDTTDGSLETTVQWSAIARLREKAGSNADLRTIYTFSASGTNNLKEFRSKNTNGTANNSLDTEKAAGWFRANQLSQYGSWDSTKIAAGTDDALIAFLRGQYGLEDEPTNTTRLFRNRETLDLQQAPLGDIVNTQPVYVRKPPFKYTDTGYAAFVAANANRKAVVYAGANDGMLHAFDATSDSAAVDPGAELWAYVPSLVVRDMYKLADATYETNHRFFVDGPITVGDAYNGTAWKTILVGGLGRGGRGYYALDVTDPAVPKALWEFGTAQDSDMGFSYGNAIITKRASDGKWVVIFASGYNNNLSPGDSKGRLYVVDAFTGSLLQEIITDSTVTDPDVSGIAKINNWVDNTLLDNTTQYVYGGDLGGSLWRFNLAGSGSSQKLGKTSATVGDQPITVRPELGRVRDGNGTYHRVVYFGTGRYLGYGDVSPGSPSLSKAQALYAVKDTGGDLGALTDGAAVLVEQTLSTGVTPRTIDNPVAVDWATKNGWYIELPVGERINVDLRLQLGTLVALSNEPSDDYCVTGGRSWLYAVNYETGAPVLSPSDKSVGFPVGNSLATGVTLIRLPTNKLVAIVTQSNTAVKAMPVPVPPAAGTSVRRVGWREIY